MKRRSIFIPLLALAVFFAIAQSAFAVTGFISTPFWISPEKPKEGDKVTLTALFHNDESESLSGTVYFYDGNVILDQKAVIIKPDEVATVSTAFTVSAGSHLFSATIKNLASNSLTGAKETYTVSQSTVKLPLTFVAKTIKLDAQAGGSSGDSEAVILDQVNKAQTAVLNIVPSTTKKKISGTANSVDNWRSDQADTFTKSRNDAKKTLDAAKVPAKKGAPATKSAGPFTYVKYIFSAALAFLFSSALVFYIACLLVIYLVFRFIFRKLRRKKKTPRTKSVEPKE